MVDKVTQIVGLTVRAAAVVLSFENIDHVSVRPAVDSRNSLHEMECGESGRRSAVLQDRLQTTQNDSRFFMSG